MLWIRSTHKFGRKLVLEPYRHFEPTEIFNEPLEGDTRKVGNTVIEEVLQDHLKHVITEEVKFYSGD